MAEGVADAFVAAYRPHVERRLAERGLEVDDTMDAAIDAGVTWLRDALHELLALPFERQPRGPLEVFQEAMAHPTSVLVDAGVEAPARDAVAVNALPGDVHNLAPASSRDLGEAVWHAHLRWGAAKAAALRDH